MADQRPVEVPVPALLPVQRLGKIARCMTRAKVSTHTVDTRLLAGLEHFQQQAALRALLLQRLQQPELQRMVIGIVVALADQQGLAVLQPGDELSRGQHSVIAQIDDKAEIGVVPPFRTLPLGQRWQYATSAQQDHCH